jgi:dipeptide transport system ATP-binding protein
VSGAPADIVVEANSLQRTYGIRRGLFRAPAQLRAVGDISFRLERGRTLAVVGESGCGKSTLARMVALIEKPTAGQLTLVGVDAVNPPPDRRRELRQAVQLVFQNPSGSLNPRK